MFACILGLLFVRVRRGTELLKLSIPDIRHEQLRYIEVEDLFQYVAKILALNKL